MNQSLQQCFERAAVPKALMTKPSNWPTFDEAQEILGDAIVSQVILGQVFQKPFYVALIATDDGVHVLRKSTLGYKKLGKGHEFFPYSQITGVTRTFHLTFRNCLEFSRASNVDKYGYMDENETEKFVALVQERLIGGGGKPELLKPASDSDPLDQLKKLKGLLETGIISQEEFEQKKRILMDRI